MQKLRIIVGGMVGQFPLGGVAWDYFHYVLALHELGHDVFYHEDTNTWPYNPSIREPSSDGVYNATFIRTFFEKHAPALVDKWHYRLLQDKCFGMTKEAFDEVAKTCDVYLNVSGVCILPDNLPARCRKAFLDSDPGYNQFGLQELLDTEGPAAKRYVEVAQQHDVHLTYAENIHQPDCRLPHAGLNWITTRPTVTLPHWREAMQTPLAVDAAYTTVMTLDLTKEPKRLHYKGTDYYDKRPEFERFITLPKRVPAVNLLLAIGNHKGLEPVLSNGWQVMDAHDASLTPEAYRDFIARSAGEWSIAKNVYAATNSGWFSCRTCCYLAAGRPAVVQDTTWSRYVPSGSGLIAFTTLDEAAAGLESLHRNPQKHRAAAYDVAREYLAPDKVVTPMLEAILSSSPPLEGGGGGRGSARRYTALVKTAKRLRHDSTFPERLLWSRLRNKQIGGIKFRRQQPVGPYVVDYVASDIKVVIELDGKSHRGTDAADREREQWLCKQGYRVLRVTNDEVLRDVDAVAASVLSFCARPPTPPSPSGGEGEDAPLNCP